MSYKMDAKMSAQAVGHVWKYADFGGAKLLVLLAVADVVNDAHDNQFWMGADNLGAKCRMNPGNVRKRLKELVQDGWLIEVHKGGGMGKTTRYQFVPVDKTASNGAKGEKNRVETGVVTAFQRASYMDNSNEHKQEEEDFISNNARSVVDNNGAIHDGKHTAEQINRNAGGIANARAALTDAHDDANAPNNPPPPANT